MTMWDLDDIVGVSELAAAFRVSRPAVGNWPARFPDFPEPLKELSAGPLYSLAQVTAWREGREWAHAGPGSVHPTEVEFGDDLGDAPVHTGQPVDGSDCGHVRGPNAKGCARCYLDAQAERFRT